MKSTKFHTADENSLGRFMGINKSIRAPPRPQSHEQRQVSVIPEGLEREIIERDFVVQESSLQEEKWFPSSTECWEFVRIEIPGLHDSDYSARTEGTTGTQITKGWKTRLYPSDIR